jgi:hypothetical protein
MASLLNKNLKRNIKMEEYPTKQKSLVQFSGSQSFVGCD